MIDFLCTVLRQPAEKLHAPHFVRAARVLAARQRYQPRLDRGPDGAVLAGTSDLFQGCNPAIDPSPLEAALNRLIKAPSAYREARRILPAVRHWHPVHPARLFSNDLLPELFGARKWPERPSGLLPSQNRGGGFRYHLFFLGSLGSPIHLKSLKWRRHSRYPRQARTPGRICPDIVLDQWSLTLENRHRKNLTQVYLTRKDFARVGITRGALGDVGVCVGYIYKCMRGLLAQSAEDTKM
jgi:hypothetical protein